MKLNPDAVREVLLFLEEYLVYENSGLPNKHKEISLLVIPKKHELLDKNITPDDLAYATEQLIKAGFISTIGNPTYDASKNMIFARINDLTWSGHEFLNDIRGKTVWESVKTQANKFGGVSLSALKVSATTLATALMTNPDVINTIASNFHR